MLESQGKSFHFVMPLGVWIHDSQSSGAGYYAYHDRFVHPVPRRESLRSVHSARGRLQVVFGVCFVSTLEDT